MNNGTSKVSGVYNNVSPEDYHRDTLCPVPSLSSTLARKILSHSAQHAWAESSRLNPDWQPTESKVFDVGTAAHSVVLGKGARFAAIPENLLGSNGAASTNAAKAWIADAREAGITPLSARDYFAVMGLAAELGRVLKALKIDLDPAHSEVVAIGKIGETWCRCMIDNAPGDPSAPLYDLKTSSTAHPMHVDRKFAELGYDFQAAHYLETWEAATGEKRNFRFIVTEKVAPFGVSVVEIHRDDITLARKRIERARNIWGKAVATGIWPGYPLGVHVIQMPEWHYARQMAAEEAEAGHRQQTGADILELAYQFQAPPPPRG